jgi:hypothetical protein
MLIEDTVNNLKEAVHACDEARTALVEALEAADASEGDARSDSSVLEPVGAALETWRDAQVRFMETVEASGVSDPATTALLLKTNHGIDASNARCGLPGTDVDGADQSLDLDLTGRWGSILTQAATDHVD